MKTNPDCYQFSHAIISLRNRNLKLPNNIKTDWLHAWAAGKTATIDANKTLLYLP
jgi:hypothetical protein